MRALRAVAPLRRGAGLGQQWRLLNAAAAAARGLEGQSVQSPRLIDPPNVEGAPVLDKPAAGEVYNFVEEQHMDEAIEPEELPPGLQGQHSTAGNRGGTGVLKHPVRGMTPTFKTLAQEAEASTPHAWGTGNAWIHTSARAADAQPPTSRGGATGLQRWEHAPPLGEALAGGVGYPSSYVPPADVHARDPEDTVYGELNEPLRLADPPPVGPASEALMMHDGRLPAGFEGSSTGTTGASGEEYGAARGAFTLHNAQGGPDLTRQPVEGAPPWQKQTVAGAAAAAAIQAPGADARREKLPWDHDVDTDMEFGA